jgi:hypothetical protein
VGLHVVRIEREHPAIARLGNGTSVTGTATLPNPAAIGTPIRGDGSAQDRGLDQ